MIGVHKLYMPVLSAPRAMASLQQTLVVDAMPVPKEEYVSDVWKKGIFRGQVVFCTGGNGTICSAQVRSLVHLGANACIVGRNQEKTQAVARDIATVREGSRVLGIGGIDVRDVGLLEQAAAQCVSELGGIDFVM